MDVRHEYGAHKRSSIVTACIYVSIALYAVSLILPVMTNSEGPIHGWVCLLIGYLALVCGCPAWASNFAFWLALLFSLNGQPKFGLALGFTAMLLALSTPFSFSNLKVGYFFWQASFIVFVIGAAIDCRVFQRPLDTPREAR